MEFITGQTTKTPTLIATPAPEHEPEADVPRYVHAVLRRWWILALAVAAGAAFGVWQERKALPIYTAQVLIQQGDGAGGVSIGLPAGANNLQDLTSAIEIIRSRTIVSQIVDSLGTRLVITAPGVQHRRVIESARVAAAAPSGSYELARRSGRVTLTDVTSGTVLASVPVGTPAIETPTMQLRLRPDATWSDAIPFVIVDRSDAITSLRGGLRAKVIDGTNLIELRYTHSDPVMAATVVNHVANTYRDYRASRARESARLRSEFLAGQLVQLADSVRVAEEALAHFETNSGVIGTQAGNAAYASQLGAETSLQEIEMRKRLLENLKQSVAATQSASPSFQRLAMLGSELLSGPGQDIYARLRQLQTDRLRLTASPSTGLASQGPAVQVLDSLIVATRSELQLAIEQGLDMLDLRERDLQVRHAQLQARADSLPREMLAHARLTRKLEAVQARFSGMLNTHYESRMNEAVEAGDVSLVDAATVPRRPDPSSRNMLFFGILAGLLLGVLAALAIDQLDSTLRTPKEAERIAGLEVIGIIPALRTVGADGPALFDTVTATPGAEAFRALRTTLRYLRVEQPKLVAVTSTGPGEGKSTVSVNLAMVMAKQGSRVLLVDADLRRPTLHRPFSVNRSPGLVDVLIGDVKLEECIREVANGAYILPCGTLSPNPAELLGSAAFRDLLARLRATFDIVIVDTPPVLAVADAAVVGSLADGVMHVVQIHRTTRGALAQAVSFLRQVRVPLLGLVVNKLDGSDPSSRYGGSGYYYFYGYEHLPADGKRHWARSLLPSGQKEG